MRSRLRAAIERWLPWFDPEQARRRDERTECIRRRSIAARIALEHLTDAERERLRRAYIATAFALRGEYP